MHRQFCDKLVDVAENRGAQKPGQHGGQGAGAVCAFPVKPAYERRGEYRKHDADSHPDKPRQQLSRIKGKNQEYDSCDNDGDAADPHDLTVGCARFPKIAKEIPGTGPADGE